VLFGILFTLHCEGFLFFYGVTAPTVPGLPLGRGFTIAIRHTALSRTLCTSDQPVAETTTWQAEHSQEADFHTARGVRTRNPSKRAATAPRP